MDHVKVAIIGAGFGGLGTAIRLRQRGEESFVILERAAEVGGVWRDNTYPGCACDVQSHLYSFSFARNPGWTRRFSPQAEIWDYLRDCVKRFGLAPYLRFREELEQASWDAATQRWRLRTSKGEFTADFLVSAAGALSEPALPNLPGLAQFQGKVFHSARWDHGYDLAGKRVAVIGTGASAIQFVPRIQPKVEKLHLFQRTPPWLMARRDSPIGSGMRRLLGRSQLAQALMRLSLFVAREAFAVPFLRPVLMPLVRLVALRFLKQSVPDPVLRKKLTPRYELGCKRILLSDDYFPALAQPNVELVTENIREIRAGSIVTSDGIERPIDALIFGTGFEVRDLPIARRVIGREGLTLAQVWGESPRAHLGTTVAGFPNLFVLLGPNTGLGHTSVVLMVESQIEHLLSALDYLSSNQLTSIEPLQKSQDAFVRQIDRSMQGTVWVAGGCRSWYLDRNGRNFTLWPGFTFSFRRRVHTLRPAEYLCEPRNPESLR